MGSDIVRPLIFRYLNADFWKVHLVSQGYKMYFVLLTDHPISQLCPNAWLCFPMHWEEMERLIALQLWLPPQWIGDDRQDIGFGIHMIFEIPCACWWAWQCVFSSFYTHIFPLLVYLRTKTITMCACIYYYYLKKTLRYFLLFFHSCLPLQTSPAHPRETLFTLWACIVWALASAPGLRWKGAAAESEALR